MRCKCFYTTNGQDIKSESGSDSELDFGQNKSKKHVLSWDGIWVEVEVLIEVTKSVKMQKWEGVAPLFAVCKYVLVIARKV